VLDYMFYNLYTYITLVLHSAQNIPMHS